MAIPNSIRRPNPTGATSIPIKVVRIFNTYGPRMDPVDGRVVSNFIMQALRGDPITVYGDGQQTRSFCFYKDLIDAFIAMMNTEEGFTGPVNTGNPNEFTIRELAELVIELTGSKSQLISEPLPNDDPMQRQPDISLAKEKLGWEPKVQLREGLVDTIAYFDGLLKAT
jgi:UDP-glucuronate decarboxylase